MQVSTCTTQKENRRGVTKQANCTVNYKAEEKRGGRPRNNVSSENRSRTGNQCLIQEKKKEKVRHKTKFEISGDRKKLFFTTYCYDNYTGWLWVQLDTN